MQRSNTHKSLILAVLAILAVPKLSTAWHDETHIGIAKVAGYYKWFNATGADMAKLKTGELESHNHYVNNPPETIVTAEMVLAQVEQ